MAKLMRMLGKNIPPELVPIHTDELIVLSPVPESKKQAGGRPRNLMLGSVPTPTPTTQYVIRGTMSLDPPRQQVMFGQVEVEEEGE